MTSKCLLRLTVALAVLPAAVSCGGGGGGGAGSGGAVAHPVSMTSGTALVITTDNGLRLRPADGRDITVDDRADPRWSHDDGTWTLDLSCADRDRDDDPCPRTPTVGVPDGVRVTATARDAGIDVAGVAAALDLTTVNGDVTVARSGLDDAAVRLVTRNGSVRTAALDAGRLTARTTNGDVILGCATAPSAVTGTTANGSVDVTVPHDSPAYRVTARTDNGRTGVGLPVRNTAGHGPVMTLTTVNGDVGARRD
ncbi:DUF4097 family beta strand repeat-containing protein [Streptomyces sp. NPDC005876]|uniref:DUF4097 family beta strand repeat-containing protein n=1 Tax=unclassified Streptomyces TaxID=2593676 RepID=UPI0033D7D79B